MDNNAQKQNNENYVIFQLGQTIVAFKDTRVLPFPTIRHTECSLLLENESDRCARCVSYRVQLNVLLSRLGKSKDSTDPQGHTNYRYLSNAEKNVRLKELHHDNRKAKRRIAHLEEKLRERIEIEGQQMDEETSSDLKQIMEENNNQIEAQYPKDSFMYLFWRQQREALAKKDPRGMRWHPLMIRWCLYLRHHSNKACEVLRDAGLFLPYQRTLRDYTYCTKSTTGFSSSVDQQLLLASKALTCEEWKKYVVVLIDEMHIRYVEVLSKCAFDIYVSYMVHREDPVYGSETGTLIGYTDLGEVNNHLLAFEQSVVNDTKEHREPAKTMLTFMVKGLFTPFKFPYVHFSGTKPTGDNIFPLFWEVVKRLERIGLKVCNTLFL